MLPLKLASNPQYRQYYHYALAGFIPLSLGYLLREQLTGVGGMIALLMGIFPNLLGSFATPYLLFLLLVNKYPSLPSPSPSRPSRIFVVFALINLFTFVVCLLIEYLHVLFQLGAWDSNDITASLAAAMAAMGLFVVTNKPRKSEA